MTDPHELLARADQLRADDVMVCLDDAYGGLVAELAAAMRAALAAQPEPLFSGRVVNATASAKFTIQADSAGVIYPGPNDRVVVYPAVAGSMAPEEDGDGWAERVTTDTMKRWRTPYRKIAEAARETAGSATPGEDT